MKKFSLFNIVSNIIKEEEEKILKDISKKYHMDEDMLIKKYLTANYYIPDLNTYE